MRRGRGVVSTAWVGLAGGSSHGTDTPGDGLTARVYCCAGNSGPNEHITARVSNILYSSKGRLTVHDDSPKHCGEGSAAPSEGSV
jgi:hypothetical protein